MIPDSSLPPGPMAIYAGSGDDKIRIYELDPNLSLTPKGDVATGAGPSFLAFDPQRRWLVTVNEGADAVESFAIGAGGALARVNAQSSRGNGPAHVSVDATGRWALVANYGSGTIAVLPVAADGTLGAAVDEETAGANAHQIVLNAANTIAYVPCLGANHIAIYDFDAQTGQLAARAPVANGDGTGPRHIAFHPSGNHAFVMDELSSTITSYVVEPDGDLVRIDSFSTLPAGFTGANTGAEIAVHSSGHYVYSSNRGHDSIVQFAFEPNGAQLHDARHISTFGPRPRHFSLVLGDSAMLVGKQAAGSVHAFRVGSDGVLTAVGEKATPTGVMFVGGFALP